MRSRFRGAPATTKNVPYIKTRLLQRSIVQLERQAREPNMPLHDRLPFFASVFSIIASPFYQMLGLYDRQRALNLHAWAYHRVRAMCIRSQHLERQMEMQKLTIDGLRERIPRCRICLSDNVNLVILYPCKHACCCRECVSEMTDGMCAARCPVCRTPVAYSETVYLA